MEAIFQQISPGCRSEMEAAMEVRDSTKAEPDISESCKLEIQASAQTVAGSREKPTKVSASASTTKDAPGVDKTKDTTEAIKESDTRKSVILIVVSILGLFGVAIGYIVYVNASQGGGNKKSSKKKVSAFLKLTNDFFCLIFNIFRKRRRDEMTIF